MTNHSTNFEEKSEICISGIATIRRHSLPTQSRRRERESMVNKMINFKTDTTKKLTKTAMERSVAKQFATGAVRV
jgi:hypothetical protein